MIGIIKDLNDDNGGCIEKLVLFYLAVHGVAEDLIPLQGVSLPSYELIREGKAISGHHHTPPLFLGLNLHKVEKKLLLDRCSVFPIHNTST